MIVQIKPGEHLSAFFSLAAIALALLLASNSAQSQTGNATLQGSVTDPSGAVIPQAVVTITNTATGVVAPCRATHREISKQLDCSPVPILFVANTPDSSPPNSMESS